ncbi:MAG: outer membrane beta-barrel protein [Sphingobacteriales bacterium]|nr:MAG: outer membrane beta-barrel protein [Sphingobacteriales bacterium]
MKNIVSLLLMAMLCVSPGVFAQGGKAASKLKGSKDRLILELAHDNWLEKPDDIKLKWYGRGLNIYAMYDVALIDDNVSIAPGGGFSFSNYYHNGYFSLDADENTLFKPLPDKVYNGTDSVSLGNSKRNKLSTSFVDAALELRFRTNPNKSNKRIKFAVGARAGYRLDAHTKYRGDDLNGSGREVFIKTKLIPNMNRFRYGLTARAGYANINLFAFYSLSELFEKDKGPKIVPFSVGISFNSL